MSTTKSNVPEVRFKGFSGAWKESALQSIAEVLDGDRGHNYPNGNDLQATGHTLFLNASNVTANGFKLDVVQYINEEKSNRMGNGKLDLDDIILTSRGSVGHIAWYNEHIKQQAPFARINSGMLILRSKKHVTPSFVAQFLKSPAGKKKIDLISFGSAQPQLTKNSVSTYIVTLPTSKSEQMRIGNYFQQLDSLITLHRQKYDKLLNIKKAMLEKMYPKKGADVPEIRFKGFSEKWEERTLGDMAKITTGSSNREDSGLDGQYTFFDRSEDIRTSDIYLFDCEAIIVAGEGSDFIPKYFIGKFDLHQRTYAIMDLDDADTKFLFYYIHLFRKYFLNQAVGSTVKSLRLPMFQEMPIKYPKKSEQIKIGTYFKKLDTLLTLHQSQLEKLKNIKKACLEKMFV